MYKIKYKENGEVERCKGRLAFKGYTQRASIDYTKTFSPVVKIRTIYALIGTSVKHNWKMHQLDVNIAFLHGELDEEIYMELPPGLIVENPNQVCKLQKSLYGLKHTSRQCYAKWSSSLKYKGYQHSKNDYSLIYKSMGSFVTYGFVYVFVTYGFVYVDGIMVDGNNHEETSQLKIFLDERFKIKDLGFLNLLLGIEVLYSLNEVFLNQTKFGQDLLKELNCEGKSNCPPPSDEKLTTNEGMVVYDQESYRRLVVKLNFLTNT